MNSLNSSQAGNLILKRLEVMISEEGFLLFVRQIKAIIIVAGSSAHTDESANDYKIAFLLCRIADLIFGN